MAQGARKVVLETPELAAVRWARVREVQELYSDPIDFAERAMEVLGFHLLEIQEDILKFALDPTNPSVMVEAQRGQAKSTVCAIALVWDLIQYPHHRNAIVMPQEGLAKDLMHLVRRLFKTLPELAPFLPDKKAGDRDSTLAMDIHHSLKGVDKSPSLAPISVEAILQGRRTDLTLLDD